MLSAGVLAVAAACSSLCTSSRNRSRKTMKRLCLGGGRNTGVRSKLLPLCECAIASNAAMGPLEG